jgi:uncharacterized protein YndB with AHSA1/START domain
MDPQTVERQIELPAPPGTVWQALTRGEELSAWFGARVELDARPGGTATFRFSDGRQCDARVEVFDPQRQLLLRWLPFERRVDGATAVPAGHMRFVLEPRGDHTLLAVTETLFSEERVMTSAGPRRGHRYD